MILSRRRAKCESLLKGLIFFVSCRGWTDAPRPCIQCNKDAQMLIQENDAKQVLSHQLYQSLLQPMSLWLKNCFQRKDVWEGNINGDNLIFSITTPCPTENVTYTPQDCAEAQSMRQEFIPLMPSVSYLIHEHYLLSSKSLNKLHIFFKQLINKNSGCSKT